MAEEKTGVQSVERIFNLIELLSNHPSGASLQVIAAESGLAKSTAHRLLNSLISLGYVMQDEHNAQYRLTLKMFEISSGIVNDMDVMAIAKTPLDRLAQRTGDAVHLVIRDNEDIIYIYKAVNGPMRMSSRMGLRAPLYCTAVGKAILSTLPTHQAKAIWEHSNIEKLTPKTITDWDTFNEQLKQVRLRGYAVDDEENEIGIRCVAVSLPEANGQAESAFSISGLAPYMSDRRIGDIARMAMETRSEILRELH